MKMRSSGLYIYLILTILVSSTKINLYLLNRLKHKILMVNTEALDINDT